MTLSSQKDRLESFRHSCRNTDKENNYKFQVFLVFVPTRIRTKYVFSRDKIISKNKQQQKQLFVFAVKIKPQQNILNIYCI